MSFWSKIDGIGISRKTNSSKLRYIEISNRVSFILFVLVLMLFSISFSYFGWIESTKLTILAAFLFLIPPVINYFHFYNLSRIILISIILFPTLIISIIDKFDHPTTIEAFEYFQFRIILLGGSILPFILFSLKERVSLIFGLLTTFLVLVLYDPIHNYFNAGYYQMGFTDNNYYWLNYIFSFSFFVLVGGTYSLKYSFEKSENENQILIQQLSDRQKEILRSSEALNRQRELLALENVSLNSELLSTNSQLIETNKELIRHNNELQQFSYTISHNLRGPLASINGLISLVETNELSSTNLEIFKRLKDSVSTLESTIKDLSNIIDIRNDITRIRQRLVLKKEIKDILTLLNKEIDEKKVKVITQFEEHPYLYSVRPMLNSILYNLISNAIKYRSPDKDPIIRVSSASQEGNSIIVIEDNGLGIDLDNFGDKVFGMYKRFHTHTDGKGLGLFLVKLQVEALGGKIDVESQLQKGTKFTITFPEMGNIEEQILLDNEIGTILYHASLNCLGIYWKKIGSVEASKAILIKSIDFVKTFQTPNWISDMSKVLDRNEKELNELRRSSKDELRKAGLRRVSIILPNNTSDTYVVNKEFEDVFDIELRVFHNLKDAKEWLEAVNLEEVSN